MPESAAASVPPATAPRMPRGAKRAGRSRKRRWLLWASRVIQMPDAAMASSNPERTANFRFIEESPHYNDSMATHMRGLCNIWFCGAILAAPLALGDNDGQRWWSHVRFLADDKLEGRNAGSDGYREAAKYVAAEFDKLGLKPAGLQGGWMQPVPFQTRQIDESGSSLTLIANGRETPLTLGKEATIGMRSDPSPSLQAEMVFAGHGLHVPEMGYDDFKGLELKGKIAVILTGAPAGW